MLQYQGYRQLLSWPGFAVWPPFMLLTGNNVMHLDVTEKRQIEESLGASEALFRQVAKNIRDVFFLIDADSNRTLFISSAYEDIWGRSCDSAYASSDSWREAI